MIKGLAHVCFRVADLDVSERFYCGQLGLRRAFDFAWNCTAARPRAGRRRF
jgi:catechol 2,3-dioxygenase-like lactoylglutathione lyase family enzyme